MVVGVFLEGLREAFWKPKLDQTPMEISIDFRIDVWIDFGTVLGAIWGPCGGAFSEQSRPEIDVKNETEQMIDF